MSFAGAKLIWMNGQMIPWEQATVHVMAHALHYGSSVFEGIRVYKTPDGPQVFRLTDHMQRFYDSAKIYRMPLAYDRDELVAVCKDVVLANGLMNGAYIRPIAFRGYGEPGLAPKPDHRVDVAVAAWEWGRPRARCGRVHIQLAEGCAEHDSGDGQGRWQLPVGPADKHGGEAPGICRGHSAFSRRHH
jgi:branched-subunit amino acid aminotransferase/4-amino-4-deoxychorismate lyase